MVTSDSRYMRDSGALNRAHPARSCEWQLEFLGGTETGKRDEPRAEDAKDATEEGVGTLDSGWAPEVEVWRNRI